MDLLVETEGTVLREGNRQGYGECYHDGHDIESHLSFYRMHILIINAAAQVQEQEDDDRQQREAVGFFCAAL